MPIADIVERLRVFFTEAEDDTLYFLANAARQRAVAAGDVLCNEGEIEDVFYIPHRVGRNLSKTRSIPLVLAMGM